MSSSSGQLQSSTPQQDDFLASVGDTLKQLIPPTGSKSAVPNFVTLAPRQTIQVYYLDASVPEKSKRAVMAALTLCGRCVDTRPAAWQSWVLTWSVICFPELLKQFQDDSTAVDYKYEAFDEHFIQSCVSGIMAQADEETAGDKFVLFPPGLPNAAVVAMNIALVEASGLEALYAYYAMIVFIMGKSLSAENISSLATKRPNALIRKRNLDAYAYILTGDGRIHSENYRHIQSGWIRSTRHRINVVRHLARMNASPSKSELLSTIGVNMDMLSNANQTYLFYIHELLTACPWAVSLPALRSPYYHYCKMVNVLSEQEDWLRPYYKLMMQDEAKEVRRRNIEPLIAVATFFAAQTRKTMNQYRVNEGTLPTIMAFRDLAVSKGFQFSEVNNQQTTETSTV